MGYMDIFEEIKARSLDKLYLFYGPEEYTKGQALSQMTAQLTHEDFKDLNYQMIDGTETNVNTIITACETLPLMSEKRLIVVKNYIGFGNRKTAEEEVLKKYLERVSDSTCLVFYCRGVIDKTRVLYKAIKKHGKVIEFERLKSPELIKWTAKAFKKSGKEIVPGDLNYFLIRVGNNLEDINNEIQKLVSYTGETGRITREIIDKLVTPSPENTVFQLIDAVTARQKGEALLLLEVLLEGGQVVFGIITLIARQLKTMLLCKDYIDKGYSQSTIIELLKVHPYMAKKCMTQSGNFTTQQLRSSLNSCLELDYGIKSGKMKERIGIEMLIIKMCI